MFAIVVAAALAAQAPAGLADGVACVVDQTPPADVAWIGGRVLAGQDMESGEVIDRLSSTLAACVQRFGWDETQSVRLSTISVGQMGRTVAEQRLVQAGIDPARLDRWFDAQSEDFRTRAFVQMAEDEAAAVLETLVPDTLAMDDFERNSALIGGYLASRVILFRGERGLPLE